jgi:3-isopropylmalate/(R)-2-methylmalate dehydratase large subunit
MGKTLFDKLWDSHEVSSLGENESLIYIDRIVLHERTGSIALKSLENDGRSVKDPKRVFCTMDHIVDTFPGRDDNTLMPSGHLFIKATREAATKAQINLYDINDPLQGIAHVISPEQGIALPGLTVVCPDSHTCSLGALGTLAWGIGSSEAEHAMATNTLRVSRPKNMRVKFSGQLQSGVSAKDLILYLIANYSTAGGSGYAVEFYGDTISDLAIEARLTLCNMAVEFSAFTGLIAPDDKTIEYVKGRAYTPIDENWDAALKHWQSLYSDNDAEFDKEIEIDASIISPMVTWGTSPQHAIGIDEKIPSPDIASNSNEAQALQKALDYQAIDSGMKLSELRLDGAFLGSCTNSRLSDLRLASKLIKGMHVAQGVKAIVVPGSQPVKREAEAEGIDRIFINAGFEWREPGCSMCFYAGGETIGPGKRVISSTNRNFEGRQGPGTRTHIASPLVVVASAITGYITNPNDLDDIVQAMPLQERRTHG